MRRVFLILSFLLVLSTCKKEDDPTVVVNASVADSSMGSIDFKAGSYAVGAAVTFSATPQTGYTFVNWIDSSTKPTETEIDAEVTRLNNAEPMRLLRVERDRLLTACDWRASSDLTLTDSWKTYRQALRDLPASATPKVDSNGNLDFTSVTFPTEPS